MSNMRMVKYETLIEDIDSNIRFPWGRSKGNNIALALIYDYEKCNEYAKVIMDKSSLGILELDRWKEDYPTYDEFKDPKRRIEASKRLVQLCRFYEKACEEYRFIFWALMILAVEKTDAEEHLALICDFAKMLGITEDEFDDIIQGIEIVCNEVTTECVFISEDPPYILKDLCDMYGISYL